MIDAHTPAGQILAEAQSLVEGARRNEHGAPERTFATICAYWNAYLRQHGIAGTRELHPEDVCRLMELLKIARGNSRENCLDAAGYAALTYEVSE